MRIHYRGNVYLSFHDKPSASHNRGPEIKKKKLKKTSSREQRSRKGAGEGVKLWAREGRKKERREEKAIKRRSRFELAFSVNSGVPIPLQPRNSSVGPFYLPLSPLLSSPLSVSRSRQLEDRFIAGEQVHRFDARLASSEVFYVGRRCDSGDSHTYN